MTPEWVAEREVTPGQAAELVTSQFPALAGARVRALAAGWDHTVYRVSADGADWTFRFPRREIALPGFAREIAVLPHPAPRLPLPVPAPAFVGRPGEGYSWPFAGARFLPGRELAHAGPADRTAVATSLGAFLHALHDPGVAAELGDVLPVDPMRRADPVRRAGMGRTRLSALRARGRLDAAAVARAEELFAAGALPPPTGPFVLVHGDLHLRHVLVDGGPGGPLTAVGVIDWGDVCLADPCVDLSIAYAAFAGAARAALLAAYRHPVDAEREARARVLAVSLCAALADHAADPVHGDPALLTEALAGIARATG